MGTLLSKVMEDVPEHVQARLTSAAILGTTLIVLGCAADVVLAILVLAKAPTSSWLHTVVLLAPGVLLMMVGAHLISRKFSDGLINLIKAIRGAAT